MLGHTHAHARTNARTVHAHPHMREHARTQHWASPNDELARLRFHSPTTSKHAQRAAPIADASPSWATFDRLARATAVGNRPAAQRGVACAHHACAPPHARLAGARTVLRSSRHACERRARGGRPAARAETARGPRSAARRRAALAPGARTAAPAGRAQKPSAPGVF